MALGAKAMFLDKDGTLVRDVPFNVDPTRVELLPGVGEGLRDLAAAGFALVVVTNQSGFARGIMTEADLLATTMRLEELLAAEGVVLDGFYFCPHHPEGAVEQWTEQCSCRKPEPGLLLRAAEEHGFDLQESWLVGDILDDIEAGNRAGCRTVMVDSGNETEWRDGPSRRPSALAGSFTEATALICAAALDESRLLSGCAG